MRDEQRWVREEEAFRERELRKEKERLLRTRRRIQKRKQKQEERRMRRNLKRGNNLTLLDKSGSTSSGFFGSTMGERSTFGGGTMAGGNFRSMAISPLHSPAGNLQHTSSSRSGNTHRVLDDDEAMVNTMLDATFKTASQQATATSQLTNPAEFMVVLPNELDTAAIGILSGALFNTIPTGAQTFGDIAEQRASAKSWWNRQRIEKWKKDKMKEETGGDNDPNTELKRWAKLEGAKAKNAQEEATLAAKGKKKVGFAGIEKQKKASAKRKQEAEAAIVRERVEAQWEKGRKKLEDDRKRRFDLDRAEKLDSEFAHFMQENKDFSEEKNFAVGGTAFAPKRLYATFRLLIFCVNFTAVAFSTWTGGLVLGLFVDFITHEYNGIRQYLDRNLDFAVENIIANTKTGYNMEYLSQNEIANMISFAFLFMLVLTLLFTYGSMRGLLYFEWGLKYGFVQQNISLTGLQQYIFGDFFGKPIGNSVLSKQPIKLTPGQQYKRFTRITTLKLMYIIFALGMALIFAELLTKKWFLADLIGGGLWKGDKIQRGSTATGNSALGSNNSNNSTSARNSDFQPVYSFDASQTMATIDYGVSDGSNSVIYKDGYYIKSADGSAEAKQQRAFLIFPDFFTVAVLLFVGFFVLSGVLTIIFGMLHKLSFYANQGSVFGVF
jgi:hypothetical protein